jgi:gamma-glutamyltranspeptidase/glutathione hydrolase
MDAPRFRVSRDLDQVFFERGVPLDVLSSLWAMGHRVVTPSEMSGEFGGGQVIAVSEENGALLAGSDPRKDGCAVGF